MPFRPGQSGNPHGRPRKGDSLAEAIRARFNKRQRDAALDKIIGLTTTTHDNPLARIRAFECLAKHGWPDELKGELALNFPQATAIQIVHKHVD